MTGFLLIYCLQTQFIPKPNQLRIKVIAIGSSSSCSMDMQVTQLFVS
jgi:hypothetical protein